MFYFLLLLGSLFLILGLYYRDVEVKPPESSPDYKGLEKRISDIERLFFDDLLEHELVDREDETINKYELILKYEKENKSIEEICHLLNMHKGEVFLLKSLYKDS